MSALQRWMMSVCLNRVSAVTDCEIWDNVPNDEQWVKASDVTQLEHELSAIRESRERIHARFTNVQRDADGKCQCPYCTGDAEALSELAADYELSLHSALEKTAELSQALATLAGEHTELKQAQERLRGALQRIADPPSDGCGCTHDDDSCCAKLPDGEYFCPECIAWAALAAPSVPSPEEAKE